MPMRVGKRRGMFRLLEPGGKIATNNAGTAIDGGGAKTKGPIDRQLVAINMSKRK